MNLGSYDPFTRGRFPVGVHTIEMLDAARDRRFPCEVWYPAASKHAGADLATETQDLFTVPPIDAPLRQAAVRDATAEAGTCPLIVFSHPAGFRRRTSTFLCTHLASHGYVVAALDHSEAVAEELAPRASETDDERRARGQAWIASRVPDVRFLLDHLLAPSAWSPEARIDPARIGIVGHSLGGWTALETPSVDRRIHAVVALAPAGGSNPRPGILPARLTFAWGRDVPTLYLVAENDVALPLVDMFELFDRTPATSRMVILRRADHAHFMDNAEEVHESVRRTPFTGELAWLPKEMRPFAELCEKEQAHLFVRGLTLGHLDAVLMRKDQARRFLAGDLKAELARRGVEVLVRGH